MERYVALGAHIAVFTKVKGALQDGERLENISWRLWYSRGRQSPAAQAQKGVVPAKPHHDALGWTATPLSEAELSTDESSVGEDMNIEPAMRKSATQNVFEAVLQQSESSRPWTAELAQLAHLARDHHLHHGPEEAQPTRREDVAGDESDTPRDTATHGAGTPISVAGSATPQARRSRANSLSVSPRTMTQINADTVQTEPVPASATVLSHLNDVTSAFTASPDVTTESAPRRPLPPKEEKPPLATPGTQTTVPLQRVSSGKSMAPPRAAPHRGRRGRLHKSGENLTGLGRLHRNGSSRTNMLQMLTMTGAKDEPPQRKEKQTGRKTGKIVFTMGGDSDDDEHEALHEAPQRNPSPAPANLAKASEEDEWSSEDEEEEARRQALQKNAERAERERLEERERKEMFKKRPIRSASLADLTLMKKAHQSAQDLPAAAQASGVPGDLNSTRSLLSTLFQPPAQPNGNKPNIRAGYTMTLSALPERQSVSSSRNTSTPSIAAERAHVPARSSSRPPHKASTLSRSKSVLAVPLLNLTSLRSSTAVSAIPGSPTDSPAESAHMTSPPRSEPNEAESIIGRTKSSTALARLSAIAHRTASDSESRLVLSRSGLGSSHHTRSEAPSSSSEAPLEEDGPSLNVQADGDLAPMKRVEEPPPREESGKLVARKRHSETHLNLGRYDMPVAVPLASPRTTRQNMLRDELSESLRQNLLWERQSRARNLGYQGDIEERGSKEGNTDRVSRRMTHAGTDLISMRLKEDEQSFHHKGW